MKNIYIKSFNQLQNIHINFIRYINSNDDSETNIKIGVMVFIIYMMVLQFIYCASIGLFVEVIVTGITLLAHAITIYLYRNQKIKLDMVFHVTCFCTSGVILVCNMDNNFQVNPTYIFLISTPFSAIPMLGIKRGIAWSIYSILVSLVLMITGMYYDYGFHLRTIEQSTNLWLSNAVTAPFIVICISSFTIWQKDIYTKKLLEQKEELKEMAKEKKRILNMMFHDLGRNSSLLSGYLEMSSQDNFTKDDLNKLSKHTNEIKTILINAKSLDEYTPGTEQAKINIYDLYQELKSLYEERLNNKKLQFIFRGPKRQTIIHNINHIKTHILSNLLSNAIKFSTPENAIIFEVSNNTISIINYGIPFKEVQRPGTLNEEGSGLGLKIVRDFCKKNDISFRITSNADETQAMITF